MMVYLKPGCPKEVVDTLLKTPGWVLMNKDNLGFSKSEEASCPPAIAAFVDKVSTCRSVAQGRRTEGRYVHGQAELTVRAGGLGGSQIIEASGPSVESVREIVSLVCQGTLPPVENWAASESWCAPSPSEWEQLERRIKMLEEAQDSQLKLISDIANTVRVTVTKMGRMMPADPAAPAPSAPASPEDGSIQGSITNLLL